MACESKAQHGGELSAADSAGNQSRDRREL